MDPRATQNLSGNTREIAALLDLMIRALVDYPEDVLVQTLREQGTAGMTYRNTWLKGFGLLDQEIEGSSAQYSSRSHIRLISPMPR